MNKLLECTKHEKYPRSFALPPELSDADCELFNAAFDHALIGWAMFNGMIEIGGMFNGRFNVWMDDTPSTISKTDPFGFPILTDDLRARLIAEMEAAQ